MAKQMTSSLATKKVVEQKKERLRADSEQKATDGSKPKVTKKTKPKPKAKKKVLVEKDDEKYVGATIPSKKLEEVRPLAVMRKQKPEKLPLAYYSSYAFQLTKLDNEMSDDKMVISEYVFGNVDDVPER